jgi:hypothetical protein
LNGKFDGNIDPIMKRKLSGKIVWTAEETRIENLNWENDPADFDELCNVVIQRLNKSLKSTTVDQIIPAAKLRAEIRRTAEQFEEKHVSLPFFVYMWMKEVIALEMKKKKP